MSQMLSSFMLPMLQNVYHLLVSTVKKGYLTCYQTVPSVRSVQYLRQYILYIT